MSGRSPRQKGDRLERAVVRTLQEAGVDAKRVPLSGSAAGYPGDVVATLAGRELTLECKARKASPLYGWLADRDALIVKADRQEPLVALRLEDLLNLLDVAQFGRT